MKSQGKLGGQNKVPRLSNDRKLAEGLIESAGALTTKTNE
ncbi:GH3 auxin-responsive promoter [Pontibacter sp. BAB1700]|nr:GH3 auxin-responsive promoter [Pontibacter sp. BAB1700]